MIVGTAGHIDHGKTTLVRALTGVDTDRLPQEKTRGISIELGYAFLDVPPVADGDDRRRIGFIDVPGHERLVHTMLAGATGIDLALLLVAADDGVMPQTREHLAVLSLLGLTRGALVVTKVDRVDASRVAEVRAEVASLVAGTPLALGAAPMFEVSAQTGQGVDALKDYLYEEARGAGRLDVAGAAFRLAIDRAFTLDGVGTVVTGTIHAGSVKVGDEVALTPMPAARGSTVGSRNGPSSGRSTTDGTADRTARIRSLHAHNASVGIAHAGQRCAAALTGVAKAEVARGMWLTEPAIALHADRLDAVVTLWRGEAKGLRSGTPVHVHVGSSDTLATVAVLARSSAPSWSNHGSDADARSWSAPGSDSGPGTDTISVTGRDAAPGVVDVLMPGDMAFVQLVLREPIGAWRGDRVVLRDASSSRTLAGGTVLDPFAPARYRRTPQRLAELQAWSLSTPTERVHALVEAAPNGLSIDRWRRAEGLRDNAAPALPHAALSVADKDEGSSALGAAQAAIVSADVLTTLTMIHAKEPDTLGPDAGRLRRLVAPRLPLPLWRSLLARLQAEGRIATRGAFVHLPAHGVRLSAVDERLAQKIAPLLAAATYEGSWARDLARDTRESEPLMRTTLARLAQGGELHQVVKDLYYGTAAIERLASLIRGLAAQGDGALTAASFRDAAGLGRKRAIQLLEYFDRVGLLRRVGDVHRLRADTSLFEAAG